MLNAARIISSQARLKSKPQTPCRFSAHNNTRGLCHVYRFKFGHSRRCLRHTQRCDRLDLCGALRPASHPVANRFAAPAAGDMPLRAIPSKAALSSAHFRPAPVAPPTAFRSELVYTVRRKGKCRNGQVTARQITFPELKRRCTMSTTCWIAVGVVGTLILLCIIGRCCCKKDKGCRN